MNYQELDLTNEGEYRLIFEEIYCNSDPIVTFDGIKVSFYPNHFDHAFFESADRRKRDKSVFSLTRAKRILWIKAVLTDPDADLRLGYNSSTKSYERSRRVAIVMYDYVVVIQFKSNSNTEAVFVTAYQADVSIGKILSSPAWV